MNPQALSIINNWVSQKTQGKIDKIVDKIRNMKRPKAKNFNIIKKLNKQTKRKRKRGKRRLLNEANNIKLFMETLKMKALQLATLALLLCLNVQSK